MEKKALISIVVAIIVVVAAIAIGVAYYNSTKTTSKEVVIYADYGSSLASKYFSNFTNATGIKVVATYGAMGILTGKLVADASNPSADVLFGGAPSAYLSAETNNIFQNYTPPAIANQSEYLHGGLWRSATWDWYPFTYAVLGMSVNTVNLHNAKLPMPTSFLNLSNPIYNRSIIMENPSTSTTTSIAYFSLMYQYFLQKYDNVTTVAQSHFESYVHAVLNNTITPIQSDDENAEVALGQSSTAAITIDWTYMPSLYASENGYSLAPALPNATVLGPTAMAIVNGAPHMTYAKDFVNWVLSKQGQQNITTVFHKPPIITGVPIPAGSFSISQVQNDIFPYNQTFTTNNFKYITGVFNNFSSSASIQLGNNAPQIYQNTVVPVTISQNYFIDTSLYSNYLKATGLL
ncbi:MAG: ABC transporter substrate-binding protein [Thermoplasmataceae archaeon]